MCEILTLDEAIIHADEVAKAKYAESMLCHANPDDEQLDECIACAREHEQLAEWLRKLERYKAIEELPENPVWIYYSVQNEFKRKVVREVAIGMINCYILFTDGSQFTIWNKNYDEFIDKSIFFTCERAEAVIEGELQQCLRN